MTGTWASGFVTGDIVTAAEYKKSAGALFDSTLGGSAANIDATSILGTYAHLLISFYGRGDTATLSLAALLRFNNDSAANYDFQYVRGLAATASAAESFAQATAQFGSIPGSTAGANLFSAVQLFIPNYGGSTNNKSFVAMCSSKSGTTTGSIEADVFAGHWRSNAAINRITFLPGSGNFVAGTRLTIHALGA